MVIANPPTHVAWFPEGDPLLPENLDLNIKPFLRELDPYQTYDLIYYPKNKINARLIYLKPNDEKGVAFIGENQFNHFLNRDLFDFSGYSSVDFVVFSNINMDTSPVSAELSVRVSINFEFRPQTYITSPLKFFTEKMLVDRYVPEVGLDWAVNYSAVLYRVLKHFDWGNDNPYLGKETDAITAFNLIDLDLETIEDEEELKFTFALEYPVFITYFEVSFGELKRSIIEIKPFEEVNLADYKLIAMYSMVINARSYIDKDLVKLTFEGKHLLYSEIIEDFDFQFSYPNPKFYYYDIKVIKKMENYQPTTTFLTVQLEPNGDQYGRTWNISRRDFYNFVGGRSTYITNDSADGGGGFTLPDAVPLVDIDIYLPPTPDCLRVKVDFAETDNANLAVQKTEYGTSKQSVTVETKVGRIPLSPFVGANALYFANNNYWNSSFEFTDITDGLVVIEVPFKDDYVAKDKIEEFAWEAENQTFSWTLTYETTYFQDKWQDEWERQIPQAMADNFNDKLNLDPDNDRYFVEGQTIVINRILPQGLEGGFAFQDYCNPEDVGGAITDIPPPYFTGNWGDSFSGSTNLSETILISAKMGSVPVGEIKSTQERIQEIDERLWEYFEVDENDFLDDLEGYKLNHELRFDWVYVQYELRG